MNKPTGKKGGAINTAAPSSKKAKTKVNRQISRLLVANRGEIACRIIATAKKMGIETIAVYSQADRLAKHVTMADYAIMIGPAPAVESYLNISRLIEAAHSLSADAIHPGYGFLSENADFAEACTNSGLIFIGPPAGAMRAMSSKSEAKAIMEHAGVPLVPGYHGKDNSPKALLAVAEQIGYPVLLKAALGGGGKGMRIVSTAREMPEAIASARREAYSAFGNELLLIEKYIASPRHIEVQIFADQQGNTIYLSDRDCSIQRRHQKIVEEAPAPNLPEDLRQAMGQAAVNAAKAIGYIGAGTVEFLLDHSGQFYFMEMNTRLQVEHPVTELITGQDLVQWQINIAAGQPLPLNQHQVTHQGHAIETRIYAEDPKQSFLPSSGMIHYLAEPASPAPESDNANFRIRVDSGIQQGDVVTSFYDPMLSKLIVWAKHRDLAISQLSRALMKYHLIGPATNIDYLQQVIAHPAFKDADIHTHFVEEHEAELAHNLSPQLYLQQTGDQADHLLAVPKLALFAALSAIRFLNPLSNWRLNQLPYQVIQISDSQGNYFQFRFQAALDPAFVNTQAEDTRALKLTEVTIDHQAHEIEPLGCHLLSTHHNEATVEYQLEIMAIHESFTRIDCEQQSHIFHHNWHDLFYLEQQDSDQHHVSDQESQAIAPLNGIVTALLCQAGDRVKQGHPLMVIEAMKMEYTVKAPTDGTIAKVLISLGDQVEHGELLVSFEADPEGHKV